MKSIKSFLIISVLSIVTCACGCAYHPIPITVYTSTGAPVTAPDLCAALTQCLQKSPKCYYNVVEQTDLAGNTSVDGCKEAEAK